jgi:hypothetical protein
VYNFSVIGGLWEVILANVSRAPRSPLIFHFHFLFHCSLEFFAPNLEDTMWKCWNHLYFVMWLGALHQIRPSERRSAFEEAQKNQWVLIFLYSCFGVFQWKLYLHKNLPSNLFFCSTNCFNFSSGNELQFSDRCTTTLCRELVLELIAQNVPLSLPGQHSREAQVNP